MICIIIFLIGSVLGYFIVRRLHVIDGDWTIGNRLVSIISCLLFSWLVPIMFIVMLFIHQTNNDKPAKW
jgi:hypothetical protein